WKQLAFILSTKGFKQSVCSQSFYVHPISKLWVYLFVWSKLLEMGDTMFIILQKKKLIFLHWFHHVSTLMITWYNNMVAGSSWIVVLNSSIHAIMYSYYSMRVAGFQVPRFIAMVITISHIVQLLGFVIIYILVIFWMEDKVCHTTWTSGFLSFMFCFSVLVLFWNYFLKTYLGSSQKSKGE
ncbi:ELOV6 protein, partial [Hemiprocne comata]|nr:ELOV6 protein [Hemiprocne comata]